MLFARACRASCCSWRRRFRCYATGTTTSSCGAHPPPSRAPLPQAADCAPAAASLSRSEPPPGWTKGVEEWRAQEPINAHAHLASMMLGSSESLPLIDGALDIGVWQSVLLVELDGPRKRRLGVHIMGE